MMKATIYKIHAIFAISFISLFVAMTTLHVSQPKLTNERNITHSQESIQVMKKRKNTTLLIFVITFSILISLYILLLRSFKKTQLLLDSRQLFLRTIIHELKTPIAKGRLIAELIEDDNQKDISIKNYEHLNKTIDEFANIEKLMTQSYTLEKQSLYIDEVVDEAIELLMLDDNDNDNDKFLHVKQNAQFKIEADFNLLSIAMKNLIFNGIKYSDNKYVEISIEKGYISICSQGKKLEKSLESYFKPFHLNTDNKNHGLGLGLYIVKTVTDIHDYRLKYKHRENQNCFTLYM